MVPRLEEPRGGFDSTEFGCRSGSWRESQARVSLSFSLSLAGAGAASRPPTARGEKGMAPCLAAEVLSIPCPATIAADQWITASGDETSTAKLDIDKIIAIVSDVPSLGIRLNKEGVSASSRCNAAHHPIWQAWEAASPGNLEEIFSHHVDLCEDTPAAGQYHSLAGGSGRKRQTPGGGSKHHALFSGKKSRRSGEHQGGAAVIDFDPMDEDEEQAPPEQPWAELQRLLVEFSEEADGAGEDDGELAVLLHQFTGPMRLEVARLQPMELLCQVPADLVAKAFALMSRSVAATSKRMAASRENFKDDVLVQAAMGGVLVMLWTISDKGVRHAGRTVFKVDEVLEACTHFLESYMAKVVLGPLDTIIAEQSKQTADTLKDKRKLAKVQGEALQQTSAMWAPVCQTLVAMTDIVQAYTVHDAELLRVTSLCILPFFHDAAEHLHSLQSSGIPLMQAIFAGYERHRDHIVQSIFASIGSWRPLSVKSDRHRCYELSPVSMGHIQMLSALLLNMFGACCGAPPRAVAALSQPGQAYSKVALRVLYRFVELVTAKFGESEKSAKKAERDSASAYVAFFRSFSSDVVATVGLPDWPLSTVAIRLLWKSAYVTANNEKLHASYRNMACDVFASIVVAIKEQTARKLPWFAAEAQAVMWQAGGELHAIGERLLDQQVGVLRLAGEERIASQAWSALEVEGGAPLEPVYSAYCKQMLLNRTARGDPSMVHSRRYMIAEWCEVPGDPLAVCWAMQWEIPPPTMPIVAPRTEAESVELARFLAAAAFRAGKGFRGFFDPLVSLLRHPKQSSFRVTALKALNLVVSIDPATLEDEGLRLAVCGLLADPAKSVRADAVKLVGGYMCGSPKLLEKYFESVCARCRDVGTSVRKSAMNILKECLGMEGQSGRIIEAACVALMPLLKDESDDIRKSTSQLLKSMWFPPLPTGASLDARFCQIRGVVVEAHRSSMTDRDGHTVVDLIHKFLLEAMDEDVRNESTCKAYIEHAVQTVIREHEDRAGTEGEAALDGVLLELFRTLEILAKARPELFVKQAPLLHQYLTGNQESNAKWTKEQTQLTGCVASIYHCVLPYISPLPPNLVKYLETDLPKLVLNAPSMPLIDVSVRCFCTLVKSVAKQRIQSAQEKQKRLLHMYRIQAQQLDRTEAQNQAHKPRALIISGMLCRHASFKIRLPSEGGASKLAQALDEEFVTSLLEKCTSQFTNSSNETFRRAGYVCLGHLFIRKPALVLRPESKAALERGLAAGGSEQVRQVVLRMLNEFIEAGDDKVEDARPDEVSGAITIRNTLMQQYLNQILECVYDRRDEVAVEALKLVAGIYDRGQVHPQHCIADLVAVQQRGNHCANIGLHVLRSIVEKHPSYCVAEVWVGGVMKGTRLQKDGQGPLVDALSRTFELRASDKGFVQRVIRYSIDLIRAVSRPDDETAASLREKCYLSNVLATLPFPQEDYVELLIETSNNWGVELGTGCQAGLEAIHDDDAGYGYADPDEVMRLCEEAARAHLLLEIARFIRHAYRGKPSLPIEVPPLELGLIYAGKVSGGGVDAVGVYRKLDYALRGASQEASRASMPKAERGRGRKPKRRSGDLAQDDEGDPGQDVVVDAAATPRVPTPRAAKSKSPPWKAALTRWGGIEAPENVEVPMPGIGSQMMLDEEESDSEFWSGESEGEDWS